MSSSVATSKSFAAAQTLMEGAPSAVADSRTSAKERVACLLAHPDAIIGSVGGNLQTRIAGDPSAVCIQINR